MRITKLPGYLWVGLITLLYLFPTSLFSQQKLIASKSIFHPYTEELPEFPIIETKASYDESFRLQLGLFANQENVEKLIEKVTDRFDLPVYIFLEDRKQKPLYRVLIGDFNSTRDAKNFLPKLKHNGLKGIVKKYDRWEDSI